MMKEDFKILACGNDVEVKKHWVPKDEKALGRTMNNPVTSGMIGIFHGFRVFTDDSMPPGLMMWRNAIRERAEVSTFQYLARA